MTEKKNDVNNKQLKVHYDTWTGFILTELCWAVEAVLISDD